MRWCAYDSDFTPNRIDSRFKIWITKGLTTIIHLSTKGHFRVLKPYRGTMVWEEMIFFFRYLQVRHYFNKNLKEVLGHFFYHHLSSDATTPIQKR